MHLEKVDNDLVDVVESQRCLDLRAGATQYAEPHRQWLWRILDVR